MKQVDDATAQAARAFIDHHRAELASPCCTCTFVREVYDAVCEFMRDMKAWLKK